MDDESVEREQYVRDLENRRDTMSAEIMLLRKENKRLAQSRDHQLNRNQRMIRSCKKLRLTYKTGKMEISRLKCSIDEKDILMVQLKHNESNAKLDAERLLENLHSVTAELEALKREMKYGSLFENGNVKRVSTDSNDDLLTDEQRSSTELEDDDGSDVKSRRDSQCASPHDHSSVTVQEPSAGLANSSIEAKAELIAVEALNKSLQKELSRMRIKFDKSQKAVRMQIQLMADLRQQLKLVRDERDMERQKNTTGLQFNQDGSTACQNSPNGKDAEVSALKMRLEQAENKLIRERETQKELTQKTVEALQSSLRAKSDECRKLQSGMADMKNEMQKVQDDLSKKSEQLDKIKALISSAEDAIAHLREVNSTSNATILEQENVIDSLSKQVLTVQKSLDDTTTKVQDMVNRGSDEIAKRNAPQINLKEGEIAHLRQVNSMSHIAIQQQKLKIDEMALKEQSLQSSIAQLKVALKNETDCKLGQLAAQSKELRSEQHLNQQMSREITDLRQQVEMLIAKLNAAMTRCQTLENNLVQREIVFATEMKNERTEQFKLRAELAAQIHSASSSQAVARDKSNREGHVVSLLPELKYWQSQAGDFKNAHDQLLHVLHGKESELARSRREINCDKMTIDFHKKTIAELESDKTTSQAKIMQLEQSVYSLATETTCKAQMISDLERKTASLARGSTSKDQQATNLWRKIAKLSTDITTKEESIEKMEKKIAFLTYEIDSKEKLCSDQQQTIASLATETSRSRKIVSLLRQQIAAMTQEDLCRDGQIIELEARLINEQAKYEKLQMSILSNQTDNSGLIEQSKDDDTATEKLQAAVEEK